MDQKMQNRINKWISAILYWLLFIALSYMQIIASMYRLKDTPSGDVTFDFYTDAWVGAVVVSVFYLLCTMFIIRIKRFGIQLLVNSILVCFLWFFEDLSVFLDREASWSTYSFGESVSYTFLYSTLPIVISLVVFSILSKVIHKRYPIVYKKRA